MVESRSVVAKVQWVITAKKHTEIFGDKANILWPNVALYLHGFIHFSKFILLYTLNWWILLYIIIPQYSEPKNKNIKYHKREKNQKQIL